MKKKRYSYKLSSFQVIIASFLALIALGTLLLMLPISVRHGRHAGFIDALFTATSASCVTGLIVHDTATYWSDFGHAVILFLIQVGGMGVITVASLIYVIAGRKAGIFYARSSVSTRSLREKLREHPPVRAGHGKPEGSRERRRLVGKIRLCKAGAFPERGSFSEEDRLRALVGMVAVTSVNTAVRRFRRRLRIGSGAAALEIRLAVRFENEREPAAKMLFLFTFIQT